MYSYLVIFGKPNNIRIRIRSFLGNRIIFLFVFGHQTTLSQKMANRPKGGLQKQTANGMIPKIWRLFCNLIKSKFNLTCPLQEWDRFLVLMCHFFGPYFYMTPITKQFRVFFYVILVETLFRNYWGRVMENFDRRTDTGGGIAYCKS